MKRIKLTEVELKRIIAESVRRVIKEYDEPFPYDYKDAREREDYFQRATQHDFPDTRFKIGRTWEDTYYGLRDKKAADDKERQKADKLKARDEKKKAEAQKKIDNERLRLRKNIIWAKAVEEAFTGSNSENDDYDGLMDFPLILKDGNQIMFHADSFMESNNFNGSENGSNSRISGEYDSFSFGLGGSLDGTEQESENMPEIYFNVSTYVSPMDIKVSLYVKNVDNLDRLATKNAITMIAKKEAAKRYKQLIKGSDIK